MEAGIPAYPNKQTHLTPMLSAGKLFRRVQINQKLAARLIESRETFGQSHQLFSAACLILTNTFARKHRSGS